MDTLNHLSEEMMNKLDEIRSGNHPEIVKQRRKLALVKEKRISAADAHRKLQIQNANSLFSYEVHEATKFFEKDVSDCIEKLVQDVYKEAAAKADIARADTRVPRSLRSSNTFRVHSKDTPASGFNDVSQTSKKRQLDKSLAEEDIRFDFNKIVSDIENRARKFIVNDRKIHHKEPTCIEVFEDTFKVDKELFTIGSLVAVYSALSQENLHGVIVNISAHSVMVRIGSGTRFSFQFDHLKSGRVTIKKSNEADENKNIIYQASRELVMKK